MTAEDFTNLHLQYLSTQAEGELPATIEHDFHNGRMVDHYFVTPSFLAAALFHGPANEKMAEASSMYKMPLALPLP